MADWTLLFFALFGALLVANATWPTRGPISLMPSWLGVFLTVDLAWHHVVLQAITAAIFFWLGAFDSVPGRIAGLVMVISSLQLIRLWMPSLKARGVTDKLAEGLGLEAVEEVPLSLLMTPFPGNLKGVEVAKDIEFFRAAGRVLKLDVYQPEARADNRPALIYVHGGGWLFGDKKDQGLPLCNHLAKLGWVCFNVNYRLSPGATWPDQLVDIKAAIAWVREHADDYGVDPSFVALAGGSAGAQIAAMAALQHGDDCQPGFESADTTVQAVVTYYGVYDLTNRFGAHNPEFLSKMVGPLVVKAFPDTEPEKFVAASPLDQLAGVSQPWLVVHGENDTLAPVVEARAFASGVTSASTQLCCYAELPAAAHAFDIYYNLRALAAVNLTARFLATAHSRHA